MSSKIFCLFLMLTTTRAVFAVDCHFDHQLVVVPEAKYLLLERLFKNPTVERETGARWVDDPLGSKIKAFLYFSDLTYLEIWIAEKSPNVGYQEGCRITDRAEFDRLALQYGKRPVDVGAFAVFGRYTGVPGMAYGGAGNPNGGLFYIWYSSMPPRTTVQNRDGIRKIVKVVPSTAYWELLWEYRYAGFDSHVSQVLSVIDAFGISREVAIAPFGESGNLASVEFSRRGDTFISFPGDFNRRGCMSLLELTPGRGKINFW